MEGGLESGNSSLASSNFLGLHSEEDRSDLVSVTESDLSERMPVSVLPMSARGYLMSADCVLASFETRNILRLVSP